MASEVGVRVNDYYNDLHPTSDYTSTSVERTCAYGDNATNFFTNINRYHQISEGLYPMGASASTDSSTYILKRTSSDGEKVSD